MTSILLVFQFKKDCMYLLKIIHILIQLMKHYLGRTWIFKLCTLLEVVLENVRFVEHGKLNPRKHTIQTYLI
ncbi:MAG: hypothetical protein A3205_01520 [Methanomassiliicoccales archaeon Mx-03]|nr:MAG: hypothetical protein A3205_01520 [Methanomassiliicoccales archaeon Mx-03]